jgi:hypothetical protein
MRSMNMLQLLGGVAAAGVIAAGTTALTGTGVSWLGSGNGTATAFIGGTLTQTVTGGAVINAVNYGTDGTEVNSIQVVVTGANGAFLKVTPSGTGLVTATKWSCSGDVTGGTPVLHATAPKVKLTASPATVTCITSDNSSVAAGYYNALTSVQLDVTNS